MSRKLLSTILKSTLPLLLLTASTAVAAPAALTYQGRILKSDGTPLEYNSVSFIFQITDPVGSCVLYQEQVDGYDMTNSGGVFDTAIGTGTRKFPTTGVFTILDSLNNSGALACQGGSTYTPQVADGRMLRVQFFDGTGWKVIAPDSVIRSVPYAGYAASAQKLGNNLPADFVLKTGLPVCGAGTFLSWDGSVLSCAPVAGASGGTVTNVTTVAPLSVSSGSSTPSLSISQATTATNGFLSSADWNTFNSKLGATTAFVGDVSGTYGATSVDKIKGTAVTITSLASGNFLKYNGSAWVNSALAIADVSGLSTQLGNKLDVTNMPASCAANQTLTFSSPSGAWVCSTIAITGSAFGSQSANLVFAAPDSAAGTPTFRALTANDLPAAISSGLWTASGSNAYRAAGNVGIGTTAPASLLETYATDASQILWQSTLRNAGSNSSTGGYGTGIKFKNSSDTGNEANKWAGLAGIAESTYSNVTGLAFYTNNTNVTPSTEKMRINGAGFVGIGTATPGSLLHLSYALATPYTSSSASTSVPNGISVTLDNTDTTDSTGSLLQFVSRSGASINRTYLGNVSSNTSSGNFVIGQRTGNSAYAERLRIDSSGNFGIGTTTPGYKLDVYGSVNATGYYLNGASFTPGNSSSAVATTGGSAGTISQTATNAATAVRTALTLQNTGTGGANEYLIVGKNAAGTTTYSVNQAGDIVGNSLNASQISGSTAASGTLTLDSTTSGTKGNVLIAPTGGNVGVGTASPFNRFSVNESTARTAFTGTGTGSVLIENIIGTSNYTTLDFGNIQSATAGIAESRIGSVRTVTGSFLQFGTSNSFTSGITNTALTIDPNGNIGIGSTAPTSKLNILGTSTSGTSGFTNISSFAANGMRMTGNAVSSTDAITYWSNGGGGAAMAFGRGGNWDTFLSFYTNIGTNNTPGAMSERLRIDAAGNVGIGTITPTASLNVYKTPVAGTISTTGTAVTGTSTNFTSSLSVGDQIVAASQLRTVTVITSDTAMTLSSAFSTDLAAGAGYVRVGAVFTAGNVGIGTTSPMQALDVFGISRATSFALAGAGNIMKVGTSFMISPNGGYDFQIGNSGTTPLMTVQQGGNVGVGITAPETKIHLYGTGTSTVLGQLDSNLRIASNTTTAGDGGEISFRGYSTATSDVGTYAAISAPLLANSASGGAGWLSFSTKALQADTTLTERMRITPTGNVGIGTTAPGYLLDVNGTVNSRTGVLQAVNPNSSSANVNLSWYNDGTNDWPRIRYGGSGSGSTTGFLIQGPSDVVKFMVSNSGSVGIGTSQVASGIGLAVNGSIYASSTFSSLVTTGTGQNASNFLNNFSANAGLLIRKGGASSGDYLLVEDSTTAPLFNVKSSGNVGIGTATPAAPLHVYTANTSGNIASFLSASGGCSIAYNGTSCSSDARLKENVETSDGTAMLNNLLQVRSVHFTWIKDPNHEKQTGFIAQELQKLFPEFIKTDSNGLLQVNYASFVSVLTASLQELNAKFTKQFQSTQRDIAAVNARVEVIEFAKEKTAQENKELKVIIQQQEKRIQQQEQELQAIKKKLNL